MLDRILLTNDDGIDAPGLEMLGRHRRARSPARCGSWRPSTTRAAFRTRSACTTRSASAERGPRRWAVTGTPGDCVVMALSHLMQGAPPQLLLSGVNRGANLGIETVFSGTSVGR